jgi:hypothetical protein
MVQLRLNLMPNLVMAKFKLNVMVKIWVNLMVKFND